MTTEKFIKKLLIKIILIVIITTCITTFLGAFGTIIGNQIALGQMENDDTWFVIMEMYNNFLKPTLTVVLFAFITYIVGTLAYDSVKFFKSKSTKSN